MSTEAAVNITLINDGSVEVRENFRVRIRLVLSGQNVGLFRETATVSIIDDDSKKG